VVCLLLVACQSVQRPSPSSQHDPSVAPPALPKDPVRPSELKIGIVLGPGGAKTFAHIGVLKALQRARVPIHAVVGLEWGAMMGALYARQGQAHDLEWQMYKLEQLDLGRARGAGVFGRGPAPSVESALNPVLQQAMGQVNHAQFRVPFACPSRSLWGGVTTWQDRGPVAESLRRCLPFPPLWPVRGTFLAAPSSWREAVDMLRRQGVNVIVLVNVLGSALPRELEQMRADVQLVLLWQEIRRQWAELAGREDLEVLDINTSDYSIQALGARKALVDLGEKSAESFVGKLISKYGL
jgi:NTE family protein